MSYTKDMKRPNIKKIITYLCLLLTLTGVSAGCGSTDELDDGVTYFHKSIADQQETQESATQQEEQEVYLVTEVDQMQDTLLLYRYANGMEYRYYYGTGTRFYDKYGNRTPVSNLTRGLLITIGAVNSEGILSEASISDQAWVYDNITRFSVDPERDILKIGDSKYQYGEDTFVFSGEERLGMTDLAQGDTLSVVGVDKKILSVCITTAQGTLELTNTELFEGSYVQIGTKIFAEITPEMELQVPEGTYQLIVANNGWGGSTEITITRGQTTTVDLDTIKGSGPSYGKIQFVIDVKDALLLVDGEEVDYEEVVKLTYGKHSVVVYAAGYDVWKRNLYVNSKKSTIVISLADEQEEETTAADSEQSSEASSQKSDSEQESESESESGSTEKSRSEEIQEELDAIQDLITSMMDTSSIVSN